MTSKGIFNLDKYLLICTNHEIQVLFKAFPVHAGDLIEMGSHRWTLLDMRCPIHRILN